MKFTPSARRIIGSATLLWLSFMGAAGVQAQPASQAPNTARNMLWRVQSGANVIYLLGSVHLLPATMYPLASPIERAFDSSGSLIFELNLDSATQGGASMQILQLGMYTDGRTLRENISKATYKQLSKRLKKLGYDVGMFERFKPWMVAFTLMGLGSQEGGFEAQYGIDAYFQGRAKKEHKPISGLETVEDQISIFSDLPETEQEKFLKQTLDAKGSTKELDVIVKAWKKGDAEPLIKLLDQYVVDDSTLYERMLFRRNRNWMPTIERLIASGDRTMVVVGTLHLVGDQGIVAMLRRKGYSVEQL